MEHLDKVKTIEDALNSKAPSIGSFQSNYKRKFAEGLITIWLIYLNKTIDVNKPMSEDQINLCSSIIVEEYYMFKVSELTLLFKRIISGYYGQFYERISMEKLIPMFDKYREERFNSAGGNSEREHNEESKKIESTISEGWNRRARKFTFK